MPRPHNCDVLNNAVYCIKFFRGVALFKTRGTSPVLKCSMWALGYSSTVMQHLLLAHESEFYLPGRIAAAEKAVRKLPFRAVIKQIICLIIL